MWNKSIFKDENFNKNLNELKSFEVQICQITYLYDYLIKDIKDNSDEDVKKLIEDEKEKEKEKFKYNNVNIDDGEEEDSENEFDKKSDDDNFSDRD